MDKNAIKRFAVWARTELIARVSLKGVEYGITEDNIEDANADSVGGRVLTVNEKKQRQALIAEINDKGYKQVMEEVAYTWFNRFSALRFMEVNGYLPSHVRVFTDEENNFKPQIITEAIHLDLDGLNMEKVYELKDAEKTEELYKYLLIVQCNALNKILPGMFQKIADYTELLLPDNLLREGSVIQQMIELIPEDDWKDAVQIIGWLYQYYNSEKKDDVFAALKKNVKITKENIPAATQLFTPDWIVRYMVENSLGRLWLEGHPDVKEQLLPTEEEQSAYVAGNRDPEDTKWHYYLEEAEQEPEVQAQLAEIRKEYAVLTPDQLKVIDPCSGSGHILAYMFDVLMKIYESYGYTTREAVASIVENNLYGLDLDDRAAQLAYFAVMMKARQYDRRFFSRGIQPHVYAIVESNHVDKFAVDYFCNGDAKLTAAMDTIISELHDAKEYGSILTVTPQDWSALYDRFAEITEDINMSRETALRELLPLVQTAQALAQKYDTVVTNPPYMGAAGMGEKLQEYVKKNYSKGKSDMFAVFIERAADMTIKNGFYAMITQPSILFLTSFEKLRETIVKNHAIDNLIHMGRGIFGIDWGSAAFSIRKSRLVDFVGNYFKPHDRTFQFIDLNDIEKLFLESKANLNYRYDFSKYKANSDENGTIVEEPEEESTEIAQRIHYHFKQSDLLFISGYPIAFSLSKELLEAFKGNTIKHYGYAGIGMRTGDNAKYLRLWCEINREKLVVDAENADDAVARAAKWIPYNKGGDYRKWYGNNNYVVNWENNGYEIKENTKRVYPQLGDNLGWKISNESYYFRPGITWSGVSSGAFSCRNYGKGFIFDSGANGLFAYKEDDNYYLAGLLNTNLARVILQVLNPTINTGAGTINNIPMIYSEEYHNEIVELVKANIQLAKEDWDSEETSWDFIKHPLIGYGLKRIDEAYSIYKKDIIYRFESMRKNEERLNEIFNNLYGVQEDISTVVSDKFIALKRPELRKDIISFISYAVGCMFGRYSLDVDGLAYAGGEWDASKYASFAADKDNIIPICDDEYFEDDIVGLFVKFVKTVYGADTLAENLKFIADALGGKGQPKDVLREYFLNEFFKDHCSIYSVSSSGKRPIYWLFDSGKKNGFKALIYMHRYQPDTIARIRTDYVHEQQARYRTAIADLEQRIANASTGERVKLNKKLTTLQAQDTEIRTYEEKIHHLADQMISIDLDDGVKKNYAIFQDVLAKIK